VQTRNGAQDEPTRSPGGDHPIRGWFDDGEVRFLAREAERLAGDLLSVIAESAGALNSNDALLVVLEREGAIDNLASFDSGFDAVEGFRRIF
jgi:predicted nucleic acid-binding protein